MLDVVVQLLSSTCPLCIYKTQEESLLVLNLNLNKKMVKALLVFTDT